MLLNNWFYGSSFAWVMRLCFNSLEAALWVLAGIAPIGKIGFNQMILCLLIGSH